MLKRILLIALLSFFGYLASYAQETESSATPEGLNKNVIHASVGFIPIPIPIWGAYGFSYERMLFDIRKGGINSIWARASLGEWGDPGGGGPFQLAGVTMLTGTGKGHFEVNISAVRIYDQHRYKDDKTGLYGYGPDYNAVKSDYVDFFPAGSLGYRFQKPDEHFVFRYGAGYPDGLYISLGAAF